MTSGYTRKKVKYRADNKTHTFIRHIDVELTPHHTHTDTHRDDLTGSSSPGPGLRWSSGEEVWTERASEMETLSEEVTEEEAE